MSEQTAKPIPTQLNIAPRGLTWKNWELVGGTDGFRTRESMEKYLCNPERVRELEECRAINLNTIDLQAETIAQLEVQLAAVQQGVQAPFMYAIADGYGQPFFEEQGCVSSEAKDLQPEVDSLNENLDGEPPYTVVTLYTHPTQQGLDAMADMFWNDADPERPQDSLHSLIVEAHSNYGLAIGDTVEVQRAISLPNIVVQITAAPDDGDIEWEIVDAAQAKQGEQA